MINIAGLEDDSITNGPGLRFVVFAQGCPHRCAGCHNPTTHEFGCGKDHTVEEIFARIRRNPLIKGVTFSGGEPFSQAAPLTRLAKMLKAHGYELAIYTGFTFEQLLSGHDADRKALLAQADILVDGPFVLEKRDILLRFRGSSNQRILDVPASLAAGHAVYAASGRWNRLPEPDGGIAGSHCHISPAISSIVRQKTVFAG